MITKENAMQIYNLYSQIEKSNEIINVLKKCKDRYEKDNEGVDIIRNTWGNHQSIELHVPHRFLDPNGSSYDGARIYQISVPDAILVLENHIVRLSKALEEEQKKSNGIKNKVIMNLEDYVIGICFDKSGEVYWSVTKKGEPHKCDMDELKMVSATFNFLRKQIDFVTGHSEVPSIVKWAYEKDKHQ